MITNATRDTLRQQRRYVLWEQAVAASESHSIWVRPMI